MTTLKKLACVASVVAIGTAAQAATIAEWTFETTQPTTAGPHLAEAGDLAATANASITTSTPGATPDLRTSKCCSARMEPHSPVSEPIR